MATKRMLPKVCDPSIVEAIEAQEFAPFTDGHISYLRKTNDGLKIIDVKVSEAEWNALRVSKDLQRTVLV